MPWSLARTRCPLRRPFMPHATRHRRAVPSPTASARMFAATHPTLSVGRSSIRLTERPTVQRDRRTTIAVVGTEESGESKISHPPHSTSVDWRSPDGIVSPTNRSFRLEPSDNKETGTERHSSGQFRCGAVPSGPPQAPNCNRCLRVYSYYRLRFTA